MLWEGSSGMGPACVETRVSFENALPQDEFLRLTGV